MAWDSSRPVPWQRLVREWLIYVAIMAAVFVFFFRERGLLGALAGLLVSGPLYLGVGYVLAKLGYQRRTLKEMGTPRTDAATSSSSTTRATGSAQRERPAPTKRTSTGSNRPRSKRRRR